MARDYAPQTGRYVESDPTGLGGGVNTYDYVHGHPTLDFDVFGLFDSAGPWTVGWQWATGTGPRRHNFTDGDPFTETLRNHQHVRDLVAKACRGELPPSGSDPYQLAGLQGIPEFASDYSSLFTGGLTGNLAAAYLGSYALHYSVTNGTVSVVVDNTSSVGSATHPPVIGYTRWWDANVASRLNKMFESGPMSATKQHFEFHETCGCAK